MGSERRELKLFHVIFFSLLISAFMLCLPFISPGGTAFADSYPSELTTHIGDTGASIKFEATANQNDITLNFSGDSLSNLGSSKYDVVLDVRVRSSTDKTFYDYLNSIKDTVTSKRAYTDAHNSNPLDSVTNKRGGEYIWTTYVVGSNRLDSSSRDDLATLTIPLSSYSNSAGMDFTGAQIDVVIYYKLSDSDSNTFLYYHSDGQGYIYRPYVSTMTRNGTQSSYGESVSIPAAEANKTYKLTLNPENNVTIKEISIGGEDAQYSKDFSADINNGTTCTFMIDSVDNNIVRPYNLSVKLGNISLEPNSSGVYSFSMPANDVVLTVNAVTKSKNLISKKSSGDSTWGFYYTTLPAGAGDINYILWSVLENDYYYSDGYIYEGATVSLTSKVAEGYRLASVKYYYYSDSDEINPGTLIEGTFPIYEGESSLTFTMPAQDVAIEAQFDAAYDVTVTSDLGASIVYSCKTAAESNSSPSIDEVYWFTDTTNSDGESVFKKAYSNQKVYLTAGVISGYTIKSVKVYKADLNNNKISDELYCTAEKTTSREHVGSVWIDAGAYCFTMPADNVVVELELDKTYYNLNIYQANNLGYGDSKINGLEITLQKGSKDENGNTVWDDAFLSTADLDTDGKANINSVLQYGDLIKATLTLPVGYALDYDFDHKKELNIYYKGLTAVGKNYNKRIDNVEYTSVSTNGVTTITAEFVVPAISEDDKTLNLQILFSSSTHESHFALGNLSSVKVAGEEVAESSASNLRLLTFQSLEVEPADGYVVQGFDITKKDDNGIKVEFDGIEGIYYKASMQSLVFYVDDASYDISPKVMTLEDAIVGAPDGVLVKVATEDGKSKKYIEISSKQGMFWFANQVNNGSMFLGATIKLANDIDLGNDPWVPIGGTSVYVDGMVKQGSIQNVFMGTFDGNGHTISGLNVTDADGVRNYEGLFGDASGATIKNLNVKGSIVLTQLNDPQSGVTYAYGEKIVYVGGIAGSAKTIENCTSSVSIKSTGLFRYVGGIAGYVYDVIGSYNFGSISSDISVTLNQNGALQGDVGGVVGNLGNSATVCANYADIYIKNQKSYYTKGGSGTESTFDVVQNVVGGVVGSIYNGYYDKTLGVTTTTAKVENCMNAGNISQHFEKAGGIVGYMDGIRNLEVTNCYNSGLISQSSNGKGDGNYTIDAFFGGIIGGTAGTVNKVDANSYTTVTNCYSLSTPTCDNAAYSQYMSIDDIAAESTYSATAPQYYTFNNCLYVEELSSNLQNFVSVALNAYIYDADMDMAILKWESGKRDSDKHDIKFTIGSTASNASGTYTVSLYDSSGTDGTPLQKQTSSFGEAVTFNGYDAGVYCYKIESNGYVPETGKLRLIFVDSSTTTKITKATTFEFNLANVDDFALFDSSGKQISPKSAEDHKYTYENIYVGRAYTYTASSSVDYTAGSVLGVLGGSKFDIELAARQSTENGTDSSDGNSNEADKVIRQGTTVNITETGTYTIDSEAVSSGTFVNIKTTDPVVIVGNGVRPSNKIENFYISCDVEANLTLKNVYLTGGGAANVVDFTTGTNTLTFEGVNIIDVNTRDSVKAAIHVPRDVTATITGSVAYLYKYEQAAGIGGNNGEGFGNINFSYATMFLKGSKQGAVIGTGANATSNSGVVKIDHSTLNIIAVARGAAIGGGAGSKGVPGNEVEITNSNVNINVDMTGAAIGGGGGSTVNDATGGDVSIYNSSVRTYIDANAANYKFGTGSAGRIPGKAGVNNNLAITASVHGGNLMIVDTAGIEPDAYGNFDVKVDDKSVYSGGLHAYSYINELLDKDNQLSVNYTISNWVYGGDSCLYVYSPYDVTDSTTVTVNGVQVKNIDGTWGLESATVDDSVSDGADDTPQASVETVTTVEDGKATTTVDAEAFASTIEAAEVGTQFVIKPTIDETQAGTVTQQEAQIPADVVTAAAQKAGSFQIEYTDIANITLPAAAVQQASTSGEDVAVSAAVNTATGTTTINIAVGGKTLDQVAGGIKVAIPVVRAQALALLDSDTIDGASLVVVSVDQGGTETVLPKSISDGTTATTLLDGSATIKVADAAITFPDVASTDWFAQSGVADFVSSHRLITGITKADGTSEFQGNTYLTRAMFATVLHRVEQSMTPRTADVSAVFSDAEGDAWYSDSVAWASEQGIVFGYGDGNGGFTGVFGVNDNITREQLAVMMYRYAQTLGFNTTARADMSAFSDADDATYGAQELSWAVASGLFSGDGGADTIRPTDDITRAEASKVIYKMVTYIVNHS